MDYVKMYTSMEPNLFPLIDKYASVVQDSEWHSEGDVYIHTNMVMQCMDSLIDSNGLEEDRDVLMYAALLHDYGKTLSSQVVERNGRECITHRDHERIGASVLCYERTPEALSNSEWVQVLKLICYHQMPGRLVRDNSSYGDYLRLYNDVGRMDLLYWLELADMSGRTCSDKDEGILTIEIFKEECIRHGLFDDVQLPDLDDESFYRASKEMGRRIHTFEEVYSLPFNFKETSTVTIMCGIPGSGKSTYAKSLGIPVISLDDIREGNGRLDKGFAKRKAMDDLLVHLRKGTDVVWDATNYRKDFRTIISDTAIRYGAYVKIIVFIGDSEVCKSRNDSRINPVPITAIDNQIDRFQIPSINEGHSLTFIHV